MTENAISQDTSAAHRTGDQTPVAVQPTPLARLLTSTAAKPELIASYGARTPLKLDAPGTETAALVSRAAVHDLGWLRRVAVRGEDRFRWLSGMVTNAVNDLGENAGAWNLVLNAQGRIQGDLNVWREGETLELEVAANQYDRLLAHFERFIIMDDVELVPLSLDSNGELTGETALGVTGPRAAEILVGLGLMKLDEPLTSTRAQWNGAEIRVVRAYGVLVPHYELWVQAAQIPSLWRSLVEAGATPVGGAAVEAMRIAEGIPVYGIDIAERDLPQETSQMRALSFSKGCYLGQEIVERIRSRGNVHRHLRPLEIFGPIPAAGVELTLGNGAVAGQITSAAELPLATGTRIFALGMIRADAEISTQSFTYAAGEVTATACILARPPELNRAN